MYYDTIQRYKRYIIGGALLFFVGIILWSILVIAGRAGKVAVTVSAVPQDAVVTFSGTNQGSGTTWLQPGDYTVVAKKDGFAAITRQVRITSDKSQNVVALSLSPESDSAKKWATDHAIDYQKNEIYGQIEANSNGEYFTKLHPITTKLPFTDPYFKIAYTVDKGQSITLTISTPSPRYRFYAIEKIREFGYDPTDFTIIFKDFHNPLEQKQ